MAGFSSQPKGQMQKLLTAWNGGRWFGELLKPAFVLLVGLALGFAFWTTTAPVAKAREMTPAEMIQSKLPPAKTFVTANKPEVLFALCGAIREWTNDAPKIVRTAAEARKEFAGDIVATGIRCLGDHPDCELAGGIVAAGLAVNPAAASNIIDLALQLAPDCRGAIEIAAGPAEGPVNVLNGPANINPPPGSLPGGAGGLSPEQAVVTICENGQNVQVPASRADAYLRSHRGSVRGGCQVTPVKNI
jgi:hypothetical protein